MKSAHLFLDFSQVKEHTSFSSMKARDPISGDKATEKKPDFFRKGETNQWMTNLTCLYENTGQNGCH